MHQVLRVRALELSRLAESTDRQLQTAVERSQAHIKSVTEMSLVMGARLPEVVNSVQKIAADVNSLISKVQLLEGMYDMLHLHHLEKVHCKTKDRLTEETNSLAESKRYRRLLFALVGWGSARC